MPDEAIDRQSGPSDPSDRQSTRVLSDVPQTSSEVLTKLKRLKGQRIPEYDAAIKSCSVTLQQIVEARHELHKARYKLHKGSHFDEEYSLVVYEELLWRAYQDANGTIEEYYFSMGGRAAVVLISPSGKAKDLDLFYPIDELSQLTPDFESTLWTCISQFQTIAELDLYFKERDAVFLELYLIVVYIFVVVEAQQANRQNRNRHVLRLTKHSFELARGVTRRIPHRESLDVLRVRMADASAAPRRVTAKAIEDVTSKRIKEALTYANTHLSTLVDRIDQYSRREAQVVYIKGMFLSSLYILALVAVYVLVIFSLSATHHWTLETQVFWHLIAIAAASGAVGAVVSVMLRVSNHPLSIDYNAGRGLIRLAGCFRPIVGAIFGLVFYVLVNAGLLLLAAPHEIRSRAFFFAAICFAAGFSERRAQDVIIRALPTNKGTESDADKSPARRPEEGRVP
jgi:hypothetical protein